MESVEEKNVIIPLIFENGYSQRLCYAEAAERGARAEAKRPARGLFSGRELWQLSSRHW